MKTRIVCALSLILITACITSAQTAAPCGGAQHALSINWVQGNFDPCLTDNNPYEMKLSHSTVGNLVLDWHVVTDYPSSSPVVVNGVVYTYDNGGEVQARSAADGSLLWQNPPRANTRMAGAYSIVNPPAVANGRVYLTDGLVVWALKASDGTLLWQYQRGVAVAGSAPTVSDGIVYVTDSGGTPNYTYALDGATGSLLWKYQDGFNRDNQGAQPAVNGNRVYAASGDQLAALDAKTGTQIWLSSGVGIPTAVAVYNGRVYVADQLAYIHCVNAATGQPLWDTRTDFNAASIAVANNSVYAQDGTGGFWALDAYTGNLLWKVKLANEVPSFGMAVANNIIYSNTFFTSTDGVFIALDGSTGTMLWSYHTGNGGFLAGPAVVNSTVYAPKAPGPGGGDLLVFHLPN
jgi:outer membrane protein assembly factor BamB